MGYKIHEIEGIGPAFGKKLEGAGIVLTDDLLKACGTPQGRRQVAEATGLNETQLLKWANLADLMRISGIGKQFSELLEASGVDTVKELKHRKPENLATRMKQVNDEKRLTRAVPSAARIARWVDQAKALPPSISY